MKLVLIDECCSRKLGVWLRESKGLEDVLAINDHKCLKGMDDDTLLKFLEGTEGYLITRDVNFYDRYQGPKSFYHNKQWRKIYKELVSNGYV